MRHRILNKLSYLIYNFPKIVLSIGLIIVSLSLFISYKYLKLSAGYYDMISDKKKFKQDYIKFTKEFGDTEMVFIVVEAKNPEKAKKFADALYKKLVVFKDDLKKIFYKVDFKQFKKNLLLFMKYEKLKKLKEFLLKYKREIVLMSKLRGLNGLLSYSKNAMINNIKKFTGGKADRQSIDLLVNMVNMMRSTNSAMLNNFMKSRMASAIRTQAKYQEQFKSFQLLVETFIKKFNNRLPSNEDVSMLLAPKKFRNFIKSISSNQDGYIFTENKKLLLMMILPKKDFNQLEVIKKPLLRIRKAIAQTKLSFSGVNAGVTGRVVIQTDEMATVSKDIQNASFLALGLVVILFMIFFKGFARPLLASICLLFSVAITFGLASIFIGYLTLFSIVVSAVIIGMGIDFGVHVLSRYNAELQATGDIEKSISTTLLSTGKANVTGAICTALSFFAGLFSNFKGIEQLGFIGGTGILVSFICMIVFLPTMLRLYDGHKKKMDKRIKKIRVIRFSFNRKFVQYPKTVIVTAIIITAGLFIFIRNVDFDKNVLKLQPKNIESVVYEHKIIENSTFSTWFSAIVVDSYDKVKEYIKKIKKIKIVGEIHSINTLIPENQKQKIRLLKNLGNILGVNILLTPHQKINKRQFIYNVNELIKYSGYIKRLLSLTGAMGKSLQKEMSLLLSKLNKLKKLVLKTQNASLKLKELQKSIFGNFYDNMSIFLRGLNPNGIRLNNLNENVPRDLIRRYISKKGRFVIYAYAKRNLWEKNFMEIFVKSLKKIDQNATGIAVVNYVNRKDMFKGFKTASLLALILVLIVIYIDFRSIRDTLFAIVPVIFGITWLLIFMGISGVDLNFANFFSIPILIGIGIENGVHILHRFKERGDFSVAGKSTGTGVILTALTTMAGFGAMIIGRHGGIRSLGIIMFGGCLTSLLSAIIVLPAMLKQFYPRKFIALHCPLCNIKLAPGETICHSCGLDLSYEESEEANSK